MTSTIPYISTQTAQTQIEAALSTRNDLLRSHAIDRVVIQKAWFIMSHLLLDPGAHIVNMGCRDGALTFAMAALYPDLHFTGLDKDKDVIRKANQLYDLDNLDFKIGDATSGLFAKNSLDAIIDSNFLHVVYSQASYSELAVNSAIEEHYKMLKTGGQIFMQDFASPPRDEFVLIELPDDDKDTDDLAEMSDAELLIWFSEHAGGNKDLGYGGFFLEELPAHFDGTRLFRLPHKWAYEFIMRKDQRDEWVNDLPTEYTFYTKREMRESVRRLGMRLNYASPYCSEDYVREHFQGKFRLYTEHGTPLDYPALSYIILATKVGERQSLYVAERRPSQSEETSLRVETMQNDKTGELVDIVRRDFAIAEILPFRLNGDGRLKIYLHDGLVRSIANAVPRSGQNIDQQRFSGHMIESITVESNDIPEDLNNPQHCEDFAKDHLDLKPEKNQCLIKADHYYPAPDFIDEHIYFYFLPVQKSGNPFTSPIKQFLSKYQFTSKGHVREFDAQQILDAISVGLIPSARLEMQILALYEHLKLKPENWTQKHIEFTTSKLIKAKSAGEALSTLHDYEDTFSAAKDSAKQLRPVKSIFVEEGYSRGAATGLSYQDIDFIIHNEHTENIAVILPLAKDTKGEVQAGFTIETMPVPARHEGKGATVSAVRYPLPTSVTNLRLAKKYLAEKLSVKPENVLKMGEPYFTHIGVTPQKIHPFVVVVPPSAAKAPDAKFLPFYQLKLLRNSLSKDVHMMTLIARSYRYLNDHLRMDASISAKFMARKSFEHQVPSLSIPTSYYRAPGLPDYQDPVAPTVIADIKYGKKNLFGKDKTRHKKIVLKENEAPSFANRTSQKAVQAVQDAAHQAADKMRSIMSPFGGKSAPKTHAHTPDDAPSLGHDFDKELSDFIKETDALESNLPRPEDQL